MGAVQAQMNDYAEPCDFHDKPQASHFSMAIPLIVLTTPKNTAVILS
jgi:hypothetical protein